MNWKNNFFTILILFSCYSCSDKSRNTVKISLVDTTYQNSFSDITIRNASANLSAKKKDSNEFYVNAKPGDKILINGKKYEEMIFYINENSKQYKIFLEPR